LICGRTAAFSRSQPNDSQLRRTSSRFCCKALLAVFVMATRSITITLPSFLTGFALKFAPYPTFYLLGRNIKWLRLPFAALAQVGCLVWCGKGNCVPWVHLVVAFGAVGCEAIESAIVVRMPPPDDAKNLCGRWKTRAWMGRARKIEICWDCDEGSDRAKPRGDDKPCRDFGGGGEPHAASGRSIQDEVPGGCPSTGNKVSDGASNSGQDKPANDCGQRFTQESDHHSSLSANGCLQQIAARRRTMRKDDDAILLQGFVLRPVLE